MKLESINRFLERTNYKTGDLGKLNELLMTDIGDGGAEFTKRRIFINETANLSKKYSKSKLNSFNIRQILEAYNSLVDDKYKVNVNQYFIETFKYRIEQLKNKINNSNEMIELYEHEIKELEAKN